MKTKFNLTVAIVVSIVSTIITSTALARPIGGAVGVRGENGAAGCIGVISTDKGAGGCRGTYNNPETNANRSGSSRWNYSEGTLEWNRDRTGTRRNGSQIDRQINSQYDTNNRSGQRNVIRSGMTQNGRQYNYQKKTTYSEGELCRTFTGDFGEYHYQNNGQLACF